jgi:hypothetical protein
MLAAIREFLESRLRSAGADAQDPERLLRLATG